MNYKILIPTILFAIALIFSIFVLSQKNKNQVTENELVVASSQASKQIIFFWGDGCPHCAVVEKYIKDNRIKEKIGFVEKEVYKNRGNAKELEEKAKACGVPTDSIGVPFLWDGEKCFIGDQDIVNFFKQKLNL